MNKLCGLKYKFIESTNYNNGHMYHWQSLAFICFPNHACNHAKEYHAAGLYEYINIILNKTIPIKNIVDVYLHGLTYFRLKSCTWSTFIYRTNEI